MKLFYGSESHLQLVVVDMIHMLNDLSLAIITHPVWLWHYKNLITIIIITF